jgi:flagellar protein FliL
MMSLNQAWTQRLLTPKLSLGLAAEDESIMAADQDRQLVATSGADGAGGSDAGANGGKKKMAGKQIVLFIILPAILLLGGGGAAAYFLVFKKPPAAADGAKAAKVEKKDKDKKEASNGDKGGEKKDGGSVKTSEGPNGEGFLTMADIVVNISTADGRPAYLKLKLTLQAKDMATIEAVEPLLPRIKDQYNGFLRELRMEDVAGSAGYARIQMELLKRVNLAVAPAQIDAVLIEEMLVN